ncbi:alpha/beta fold hydrolase [Tropicimonas marinistellae]|uniref:alpha/beta fold hydrolase n=1 Tax=Tropicimonas marinistellae TaxID=1739787 RepID=UPI0008318B46|nr:alpha/beta hydrolase [Tropicimonas marinistellae]
MTPLVLLPGMMCDARLFGPQFAAFSGRVPLVSFPIGNAASMAQLARGVLKHAPPRFALAGLSMGGILAMEIVRQAPNRVDRLALLDTNPLAEQDAFRERRLEQIARVRHGHLRSVMRDEMKPNYLAQGPDRDRILELCMEMALGLGPEVFVNQSLALRDRPDQRETLRGYAGQALILCGGEDRLCPVERHELMRNLIAGSHLVVVPGAGHLTTLEKPDETNAAIAAWLEA